MGIPWISDLPKPPNSTKAQLNALRLPRCLWVGIHCPNRSMDRGLSTRCAAALVRLRWGRCCRVSPPRHGAPGVSLELSESVNFTYAGTVWTATWKLFFEGLEIEEFGCHPEVAWNFGDINFEIHLKDPFGPNFVSSIVKGNIKADEFQTFLWEKKCVVKSWTFTLAKSQAKYISKKKINHDKPNTTKCRSLGLGLRDWGNLSGKCESSHISVKRDMADIHPPVWPSDTANWFSESEGLQGCCK